MKTIIAMLFLAAGPALASAQAHDSAFHRMQTRGKLVMGVDQYKSKHQFDDTADGGRIALLMDEANPEATTVIRSHLKTIAKAFQAGDFTAPALVHMKAVPGTDVMTARRKAIKYTFKELPRGGELRITTRDPEAIKAIHAFLAFQREEHTH